MEEDDDTIKGAAFAIGYIVIWIFVLWVLFVALMVGVGITKWAVRFALS